MGTSFDCPILFSAHAATGQIIMGVGPFKMGDLAEMLEYLGTEEFREAAIESAARALTPDDTFTPSPYPQPGEPPQQPQPQPQAQPRTPPPGVVIHLRGLSRTACGLDLWVTGPDGRPEAAVGSVPKGYIEHVTCKACRYFCAEHSE